MKLVSLNIEKRNHLEKVRELITREKAEVVALMEVCEADLDGLLAEYPHRVFGANFRLADSGDRAGAVIVSRVQMTNHEVFYADGNESLEAPIQTRGNHRPVVVMAEINGWVIGATHFTWTPDMSETDKQKEDLGRLLTKLADKEIVLCGDFNIPRGNGTYKMLAERYKDNVPAQVTTTIDFDLHRAKREGKPKFEAVVDYIWTTSGFKVTKVRLENGVSDHYGLVANIKEQASRGRTS